MRTFFADLIVTRRGEEPRPRSVKFEANDLNSAARLLHVYDLGASIGNAEVEVTSLAAYKTRGREYEDLF